MIRRTRAWLLSRKDDSARAFHINPRLLEHFGGAPADVTNAYIVWALTCAKLTDGFEPQASARHITFYSRLSYILLSPDLQCRICPRLSP